MPTAINLQPTYGVTQPVALPGMPATMHGWDADTYTHDKDATAPLGFGVACSKKAGAANEGKVVVVGGTAAAFAGVTYRDITQPPPSLTRTPEGYAKSENVGVMVRGDIWVQLGATAGGVAVGDAVKFVTATGVFDSAGTITLANAEWKRGAAANGLALLRLNHPSAV